MKGILFLTAVVLIHAQINHASLIVKGPPKPIVAGDKVTLECYDSDSAANMSQVHFERSSKFSQGWYRLEMERSYLGRLCSYRYFELTLEDDRLLLTTYGIPTYMEGLYRCVSDDDALGSDNSSTPLSVTVHYMHDLSFTRESHNGYYNRFFNSMQDLRVPLGSDVEVNCSATASETPEYFWQKEGSDWILPSKTLTLREVTPQDEGTYTCTAQHPSVESLRRSRSFTLTVLAEDACWYESTDGRITLTAAGAGMVLLVLVVFMTAFLCRRAKMRQTKGPIDDHSQTKPIYKGSMESLPSTTGDNQPLV
ncbi:basal cell adhesion molecule [Clupea harengus]|uniref:Basal cell adhesion molecule n=1 Tax=Clupea harengus TaxID=7950 RepID=A0A6P3VJM6_CLUHA|nr:basal cell adhesion molecule [Clupea harengus]